MTPHALFRAETQWPGYDGRGDHSKPDDESSHSFTLSRYDRDSSEWEMEKAPVHHIAD